MVTLMASVMKGKLPTEAPKKDEGMDAYDQQQQQQQQQQGGAGSSAILASTSRCAWSCPTTAARREGAIILYTRNCGVAS
jgi:hypothetical protein